MACVFYGPNVPAGTNPDIDGYASISVLQGDAHVRIAVGIANNLGVEQTLARDALSRM